MTEEESKGTGKRKNRDEETESEVKKGKRRQVEKDNGEAEWREEMRQRFDRIDGVLEEMGKRLFVMEEKLMQLRRPEEMDVSESEESDEEEEKEVEDKMHE